MKQVLNFNINIYFINMRHKQAVTYYVKSSEFCNFTDSLQNPQNNTYDITSKIHKKLHHFLTPCHVFFIRSKLLYNYKYISTLNNSCWKKGYALLLSVTKFSISFSGSIKSSHQLQNIKIFAVWNFVSTHAHYLKILYYGTGFYGSSRKCL